MRKHSLDVAHAEYRRESFHSEHALQSLLEIEGENSPLPLTPPAADSPTRKPSHATSDETLHAASRPVRQRSPLSRESSLTEKEKQSKAVESKTARKIEWSKDTDGTAAQTCDLVKQDKATSESSPTQACVLARKATEKESTVPAGQTLSVKVETVRVGCDPKVPECIPTAAVQEQKHHAVQTVVGKGQDKGKTGWQRDSITRSTAVEAGRPGRGTQAVDVNIKAVSGGSEKGGPDNKAKAAVTEAGSAQTKSKAEKTSASSRSTRAPREEKSLLEVLEENPVSHSPTTPSPSGGKSRAISPGDRSSFVTQLTSVAKTVLGPMKLGSQDGGKGKDSVPKTSEDKRAGTLGKSEASSGARRTPTGTWPGPGSSKSEKALKSSSKHS